MLSRFCKLAYDSYKQVPDFCVELADLPSEHFSVSFARASFEGIFLFSEKRKNNDRRVSFLVQRSACGIIQTTTKIEIDSHFMLSRGNETCAWQG